MGSKQFHVELELELQPGLRAGLDPDASRTVEAYWAPVCPAWTWGRGWGPHRESLQPVGVGDGA